jgi:hypothetical protein
MWSEPAPALALRWQTAAISIAILAHGGYLNYHDQEMQLADACLVRMSELKRDCRVFTLDRRDFRVYRRFDRQVIPLVAPE